MKSATLFSISVLYSQLVFGQADPATQFNVKIIPPSPEAAALGKYGEYPVSLNNGLVNISIPVYEIKTRRLSLPISLSYHAGGVKAYDVASSVGLQWSLNAGGAITRTILGIPDETPIRGLLSNPFPDPSATGEHLPCFFTYLTRPFLPYDGQADIFNYNLGGSSGKFVFKNMKAPSTPWEIVTIPYSPVKISVSGDFKTFTIVNLDGATYTFGQVERTVVMADGSLHSDGPTAWFLTSILSADKSDAITFTYTQPVTITSAQASNTMSEREDSYSLPSRVTYSQSSSVSTHSSVNIKQITFNTGKVVFEYAAGRTDVGNALRLNAIEVYQKNNGLYTKIKRLNFVQDYFTASPAGQTSQVALFSQLQPLENRLRLASLYEEGFKNGISSRKPPYTFEYETGAFPLYGSTAQDFMGFYNGAISNRNLLFYDLGNTAYGPVISQEFGANRTVNPAVVKAGSLKRITYPTGGNTLFELEPNQINYTQSNTDSTYNFFGYSLISHDLANYEVSFTVTSAMTGNKTSRTAQFKIDLVNNTPSQPVFSTTVSLFDVTAGSYVDFAANFYPGPGPAVYTITPATPTLNQLRDVTLRLNHTYKLSYGSGQPVTNNVLFTAINWQVPTGTVTYTVNKTDYTGGLRIKSITNDDGLGHTTKKKYGYSKWYYNSNLFNGNIVQMADWFKARTKRWFNMNPQLPLSGDFRWYNAYGENITFQLGSSSNTVVAYEEVEEYAVDALDKPLGKTVSTFNKAADNIPSMAPYFRSDEEWKRSQLANQKVYKTNAGGQFVLLKDAYNQYDYTMMEAVKSFSASLSEDGTSPIQTPAYKECPLVLVTNVYKWMDFDQNVYRSNLISDSTIQYDENGLNPTTLVTQYIYGNPKHNLITRTTKGTSDGKSLVNNLKYPHDYTPSSCVLDICYTNYNSAIANLLAQRKACELTNYNQFASFSDPNSAGANSAFNLYLGCEATYQNQAQAALTTLASCTNTYANCIGAAIGAAVDPNKSLLMMQRDNVVNREVENTSGILINGTEYITAGTRTDFKTIGYGTTGPDIIWGFNSGSFITKAIFDGNPAAYYRKIGNFVSYDNANNVTQKAKDSDFSNSFLWDYNKEYPIAEVLNASADDIAYTSFEADGTGNWSVTSSLVNTAEGRTGNQSYSLTNGSISKYGLLLNKKYTLSFWGKTGASVSINGVALSATSTPAVNGWQYYETTLTGSASAPTATLSGTLTIDELRFFPAQAQMTTYTYDPLRGLTSQTDANSQTTYFEYDAFGRLATMKDSQSNILKTLQYNYKQ